MTWTTNLPIRPAIGAFLEGDRLLDQHTEDVFGQTLAHRRVRIMVTMPILWAIPLCNLPMILNCSSKS
jgi:hypothetical protein